MVCKTCTNTGDDSVDPPLPTVIGEEHVVPVPVGTVPVVPAVVNQVRNICSTIRDECHDCDEVKAPFARIQLKNAFALPACDQEVEAIFTEDISNLMVGLSLYAVDAAQKSIRLKITKITPKFKLTLKNICSSCCGSTKPVGETIIAETYFSWGLPDCCATANSTTGEDCLRGTFFFPGAGATAAAQVKNSNNFILGGLYSMGGFIWKVAARVTSVQILLQNPSPGNGSVVGGFIEGGCDGECIYPITPISEASECDDTAVSAVTLIGCTTSGKRKLTSEKDCGYVRFDKAGGSFSVVHLLGGSTTSGPHYIQWDKDVPCNSKLISAPTLAGSNCSVINCSLFLTPANANQEYEVEVGTSTPFTSTAPNNVVTLAGRQFNVVAVVTAATPGKIRIKPRFAVNVSETIATLSQICVVEGCQPFPSTDYTLACALEAGGEKVYCANDGLRTSPRGTSAIGAKALVYTGDTGGIEVVGTHARPVTPVVIVNPSSCYGAVVMGQIEYTVVATLDDDGRWVFETLYDVDAAATTVRDTFSVQSQNGQRVINVRMVTTFSFGLNAGQTKTLNIIPRVRTTNNSANTNLVWSDASGLVTWHITTI